MTYPHLVVARLYEHIGPIDRGVIEFADVEIALAEPIGENTHVVVRHGKAAPGPREVRRPRWRQ